MMLLKGAQIEKNHVPSFPKDNYFKKYQEIIHNKDLVEEKNGTLVLKKDLEGLGVSLSACIVKGSANRGWTDWKNIDGKTMDELFRQ